MCKENKRVVEYGNSPIVVREKPDNYLVLQQVGDALYRSGMFPNVKNQFGAFAVVLYGSEIGIGPMIALQNINVIKGKLACNGQLMLSQAVARGVVYEVLEESSTGCSIRFSRGGITYISTFEEEDAKSAGLLDKDNWRNYPRDMYFWRAVAKGVRRMAPDAVMGMYTPDELTDGEVVSTSNVTLPETTEFGREKLLGSIEDGMNKTFSVKQDADDFCMSKVGKIDPAQMTDIELELLLSWVRHEYREKQKEETTTASEQVAEKITTQANGNGQDQENQDTRVKTLLDANTREKLDAMAVDGLDRVFEGNSKGAIEFVRKQVAEGVLVEDNIKSHKHSKNHIANFIAALWSIPGDEAEVA